VASCLRRVMLLTCLSLETQACLRAKSAKSNFWIPSCDACNSIIKPSVVFFGEGLPGDSFDLATEIAHDADAMIIAGTSMNVMTPFVFVQMMKSAKNL